MNYNGIHNFCDFKFLLILILNCNLIIVNNWISGLHVCNAGIYRDYQMRIKYNLYV